jgi:23S rRNA (adenine2503-C2)-methyltransferase
LSFKGLPECFKITEIVIFNPSRLRPQLPVHQGMLSVVHRHFKRRYQINIGNIVKDRAKIILLLYLMMINIVMMGMGEPLANYLSTLKAIQILTCDFGLGMSNRRITVSTCGLAPQIVQLGKDICINLAVSLNAHDDQTRSRLMPVNRKYPLATLLSACKKYPMPGRHLLTFEYILIDGINSSRADAEKLARLLKDQRCKLNLIVFNEYPSSPFKSPSPQDVSAFQQILLDRHFTAMLRKSKGGDILAACGQLSGAAEA